MLILQMEIRPNWRCTVKKILTILVVTTTLLIPINAYAKQITEDRNESQYVSIHTESVQDDPCVYASLDIRVASEKDTSIHPLFGKEKSKQLVADARLAVTNRCTNTVLEEYRAFVYDDAVTYVHYSDTSVVHIAAEMQLLDSDGDAWNNVSFDLNLLIPSNALKVLTSKKDMLSRQGGGKTINKFKDVWEEAVPSGYVFVGNANLHVSKMSGKVGESVRKFKAVTTNP